MGIPTVAYNTFMCHNIVEINTGEEVIVEILKTKVGLFENGDRWVEIVLESKQGF